MANTDKKQIAIIANGAINNKKFHKQLLVKYDTVICADGGANHAIKLNIIPDYIVGDLDSITKETTDKLKQTNKTKTVYDPNQNKTDLEIAIKLAITLKPSKITIFGAIGNAMDHTLANILSLMQITDEIDATIIDDKNEIHLVDHEITITGKKDDVVSIIPLTSTAGLTYKGLKWTVTEQNTPVGWLGIRNRMLDTNAKITLTSGKIIVIKETALA